MYKSNGKIQRKIRQYSNKLDMEKKFKEKIKEFRKNEILRHQRSSKAVDGNTRNRRNPKLKKQKKKWKLKKEEMKIEKRRNEKRKKNVKNN